LDVQEETVAKRFFWLDIFGGGEAERTDFLNHLGWKPTTSTGCGVSARPAA